MRYNIIDEAFEQILARNGAEFVKSVPVEYTPDEVKLAPVHLTTGVLGHTMVGFASHRELIDTPVKNATRRALCYQNRGLLPDFFILPKCSVIGNDWSLLWYDVIRMCLGISHRLRSPF